MLYKIKYHLVYMLISLIGLAGIIVFYFLLLDSSRSVVQHEDREKAHRIAMELENSYFNNVTNSLYSLAGLDHLKDALQNEDRLLLRDLLMVLKKNYPNSVVYIMDRHGEVIEGTPYNVKGETFRGKNYGFRPYFYRTKHGASVVYPATGVTSRVRGLYFSRGVFREGEFLGTLVVKLGVAEMEMYMRSESDLQLSLMTPEGVVFASCEPSSLYSFINSISGSLMNQIEGNKQFAGQTLSPLGKTSGPDGIVIDGTLHHFGTVNFRNTEWTLLYMKPLTDYAMRPEDRMLMKIIIFSFIPLMITLFFLVRILLKKKDTEESLRLYNFMVEQSPVSIVVTDLNGNIEYTNPFFTEHTGYERRALVGENPRLLKSGIHDSAFYENLWKTVTGGRAWSGEICNRKRDGTLYWESARIYPLKDSKGNIYKLIGVKTDISSQKEMIDRLKYYASVDEMTSVMNRRTGMVMLEKEMNLGRRGNHIFSLCYADINDLKFVNDTLGHNEGDKLIQAGTDIIKDVIRNSDSVCRVGGDEFLIILPDSDLEMSRKVVERIHNGIELYNLNSCEDFVLSLSFGIVQFHPEKHECADDLIKEADEIMYKEKQRYKKLRDELKIG